LRCEAWENASKIRLLIEAPLLGQHETGTHR
jgi:hypothetical protein